MANIEGRSHFSLTAKDDKVFIFGGEAVNNKTKNPDVFGNLFSVENVFNKNKATKDITATELSSVSASNADLKTNVAPSSRSAHQTVAIGDNLFCFGGEYTSPNGQKFLQFNDLWRFNLKTNKWSRVYYSTEKKNDIPSARSGHRMVAVGTKLFVFGGFFEKKNGDVQYLQDLHSIDLAAEIATEEGVGAENSKTLTWVPCNKNKDKKAVKPTPRSGFCMWSDVSENKLYVFGGTSEDKKGNLNVVTDCFQFDVEKSEWKIVEQNQENVKATLESGPKLRPKIRTNMAFCKPEGEQFAGKVLFFGGVTDLTRNNSVFHDDILLFDYKENMWTRLEMNAENKEGSNPKGRIAAQIAVADNTLVLFGGSCESDVAKKEVTLNDMWRMNIDLKNPGSNAWECVWAVGESAKLSKEEDVDSESDDDMEE